MSANSQDIITPHITDSHAIDYPCLKSGWVCEHVLPRWTLHIGSFNLDVSPTKHVVMLWIAGLLCLLTLTLAARSHNRHQASGKAPRGFANGIEAMVLYLRNEVVLPNVGPHGDRYVPFVLTLFFFILFANLLGLIPYGSTATGNISVTATLAVVSFIVIEIAGMRALGKGYWNTIFYWPHDEPLSVMKVVLFLILTPVELLGKITKPVALALRLFANMTAGHVIVLAFIGIVFTFGSWFIAPAPIAMAIGIMLLEVLVALLQAYIFTLLTAVFIGQIREAHH
jgi:F-type H+-transporting ATPase subunit a